MPEAIIFDSETTGLEEPEIVQSAVLEVFFKDGSVDCEPGSMVVEMFKPSKPIEWGAKATHHIFESDLNLCPASADFQLPSCDYLIGHNVDFDWKVAGEPNCRRIDTMCLARKLWPEVGCAKQSAFIYYLFGESMRWRVTKAHDAAMDVGLCLQLLRRIAEELDVQSFQELWERSEEARIPELMPFGKHRGEKIAELPRDYVSWCLDKLDDLDPYLRKALEATHSQR